MLPRTGSSAVEWAARQHSNPTRDWTDWCLKFVRSCHNVPARYGTARIALTHTRLRHHSSTPPAGVPVWFLENHVAESAGGGYVWSNDILRVGKIDKVPISLILRNWGMTYAGWSEDINGVDVYPNKPPTFSQTVSLAQAVSSARNDFRRPQGFGLHEANTKIIERALKQEGLLDTRYANDGYWGTVTRTAYAKWQRRCGVGGPYDGVPGRVSLTRLGREHNFKVRTTT